MLFLLVFLLSSVSADAAEFQFSDLKLRVFGIYGNEIRFDTDFSEAGALFAGVGVNLFEHLEIQFIPTPRAASGRSKHHTSINYHIHFFRVIEPFVNLGLGWSSNHAFSPGHINFDAGVQLTYSSLFARVWIKTQNRFWGNVDSLFGEVQYGDASTNFALGYRFH